MRQVYLDEAGISNPRHEPYAVIAGVIISPDEHWKPLERYLKKLTRDYLPDKHEHFFRFHAKDVFHGSGAFDRTSWPREKRWELLSKLVAIPAKFQIPVVTGYVNRAAHRALLQKQNPGIQDATIRNMEYATAFFSAVQKIEKWMLAHAGKDEVAMLNAEATAKSFQMAMKMFHDGYREEDPDGQVPGLGLAFHSTRIVDGIHYASKDDSALLQIADICAFVIKRRLMKRDDVAPFYELLEPQIELNPRKHV